MLERNKVGSLRRLAAWLHRWWWDRKLSRSIYKYEELLDVAPDDDD